MDCRLSSIGKVIQFKALIDTGINRYTFLNTKLISVLCDALDIEPQQLAKPKGVKAFNGQRANRITHGVYPYITIDGYSELTAPFLITDLGAYNIILGYPWIKRHRVSINYLNDKLVFRAGYYTYLSLTSTEPPVRKEVQQAPEEVPRITILKRKENHRKKEQIKTKTKERKKTASETEEVDICSVSAAPFLINASKKQGGTVFSASIKEINKLLAWYKRNPGEEVTISSINAEADQYNDETLERLIPE